MAICQLGELAAGRSGTVELAGDQRDLDVCGQQAGRRSGCVVSPIARRIAAAAAWMSPWVRRRRARPGCGSHPHLLRLPIGRFGLCERAAQAVDLPLLIERLATGQG